MKGNFGMFGIVVVVCFVTALFVPIAYVFLDEAQNVDAWQDFDYVNETFNKTKESMLIAGDAILFLLIGSGVACAIASFFSREHPIFFIIAIMIFTPCLVLFAAFSNVFTDFSNFAVVQATVDLMPNMSIAMDNLPLIAFGFFIIIMVITFAVRSRGNV